MRVTQCEHTLTRVERPAVKAVNVDGYEDS